MSESNQRKSNMLAWETMIREMREKEFQSLSGIEKLEILFECDKDFYLNGFDYVDQVGADDFDKVMMEMCIRGKVAFKNKE